MSRSAKSLASSSFFNKALADPQTILALMSKIESCVRTYNNNINKSNYKHQIIQKVFAFLT